MSEELKFPNYQPPSGIPLAHPKHGAPLMKLAKQLMKPRMKSFKRVFSKPSKKPKWL
jgi:hypothetical protein